MQAGQLRQQIVIQQRSQATDDFGGQGQIWQDFIRTRCFAQPTGAAEREAGGAIRALQKYTFTMRWQPGITAAHRVLFEGKFFDIVGLNDVDSRHKTIEIQAQEGFTTG
jgi:SPP1 family predicted phage head-tail adaptor